MMFFRSDGNSSIHDVDHFVYLQKQKSIPCAFSTTHWRKSMLAPKAPRSVYDHRPVAVQVVKQQKSGAVDKHVLIVDATKPRPAPPKAK
jgi:hypothetical protein